MIRDYSQFLPNAHTGGRTSHPTLLETLGWHMFFTQQISTDEMAETPPVRVIAVHRSGLHILGEGVDVLVPPRQDATIGDWLLYDHARPAASRLLQRKSLFKRRNPGTGRQIQLIAANVDTAFIVSSCNHDFNIARLERYIALSFEAGAAPVIVLTKSDLCAQPQIYADEAEAISGKVPVVALDARWDEPESKLADWLRPGQTLAFLGSSGVGKSTLVNALSGASAAVTQTIREDDSKGRHTTTARQLHMLPNGCVALDTPGMRELQLTDAEAGIADVFAELTALAARCKFNDCRHETEPGCAVRKAVEEGEVAAERLARWRKLAAEERFNSASLAERKAKNKALGKTIRQIMKQKNRSRKVE